MASRDDGPKELVEMLTQGLQLREISFTEISAHAEPHSPQPLVKSFDRGEPLQRFAEAATDRCDEIQRQAAGVEAKGVGSTLDTRAADRHVCVMY